MGDYWLSAHGYNGPITRQASLAIGIDGQYRPRSRPRPPTNPWRHAYTRRKHFERAAWEVRGRNNRWRFLVMSRAYQCAADNADWGTRV